MSWKSLLTAGLLCVLASPLFAQPGPTVTVRPGGTFANNHLNAAGEWVWNVYINPDMGLNTNGAAPGTPVAAEFGFRFNESSADRDPAQYLALRYAQSGQVDLRLGISIAWRRPLQRQRQSLRYPNRRHTGNTEVFAAVGSANLVAADRVNLGPDLISGGANQFGIPFMQFTTAGPETNTSSRLVSSMASARRRRLRQQGPSRPNHLLERHDLHDRSFR